jgi:ABC-type antimicrobial peptide transport system permease subunit
VRALEAVAIGLAVGLGVAAAITRLMQSLLFGVAPFDPPTFVAAPAILLLVALVACWLPARRAAGTDVVRR